MGSLMATAGTSRADYTPDGPVAKRIASVTPYFPFKGIPRFYDIGGFLKEPEVFQMIVDIFVDRYYSFATKSVVCSSRGFLV